MMMKDEKKLIWNRKENSEENEGIVKNKERMRTMTMSRKRRSRRRRRRRLTTRMRRSRIGMKMLFWCTLLRKIRGRIRLKKE